MKIINEQINTLPKSLLTFLEKNSTIHTFKTGQAIYYKGHLPYGLFFLVAGNVKKINDKGKISKIKSGSFIDTESFISASVYKDTAIAESACTIQFLSNSAYKLLIEKKPEFLNFFNPHS